jgi:SAM-dependent methyltransferase
MRTTLETTTRPKTKHHPEPVRAANAVKTITPASIETLLDEVLREYVDEPVDLLGIGDAESEARYRAYLKPSYLRTLQDVVAAAGSDRGGPIRVLEIGGFLGVVSITLARLGYAVTITEIPEFLACEALRTKLDRDGIGYVACNLRDYRLAFDDDAFDVVVCCEVLEHLNFNPLPVVAEVNRVLRTGGLLYVALPNLACLDNRMRLLRGESIHNPIRDFFAQLDPNDNMIVGLHWREYTAPEVKDMLERMGFEVTRQAFVDREAPDAGKPRWSLKGRIMKRLYRHLLGVDFDNDPSLKKVQVTFAEKREPPDTKFHFCDATR